jgi:hypothetical protein
MLNQCLKNTGEGLLHACISSTLSELTPSNEELFHSILTSTAIPIWNLQGEIVYREQNIHGTNIVHHFQYTVLLYNCVTQPDESEDESEDVDTTCNR